MLRSRLVNSINSSGIVSVLAIDDSCRLLVAKNNGDIEVYITDHDINGTFNNSYSSDSSNSLTESVSIPLKFKLSQIYSNLLRNLPNASNLDLHIQDMLYSEQLNTIFIKCKSMLVLLNSANLQVYDKIYDKRGINQVWVKTYMDNLNNSSITKPSDDNINSNKVCNINIGSNGDPITYLVYSTTKASTLRVLFWRGRTYNQMLEINLPKHLKDQTIKSIHIVSKGDAMLFTMSSGVYIWYFKEIKNDSLSNASSKAFSTQSSGALLKISQVYSKRYPDNVVDAIFSLKGLYSTENGISTPSFSSLGNIPMVSNDSRQTKYTFWRSVEKKYKKKDTIEPNMVSSTNYKDIRYIFEPSNNQILILDGITQNMFTVDIDDQESKLIAVDKKQFFQWNKYFNHCENISSDLLLLHNKNTIKFVDYNNGFTFLEERIDQGIKKVINLAGIYYIVWTLDDQLLMYIYQVDDDEGEHLGGYLSTHNSPRMSNVSLLYENNPENSNDSQSHSSEFSICAMYHDSNFYHLWRKVLFYRFFLKSPYALQLCISDDPYKSLDICAMKLRELTVMWCLQMFDALQNTIVGLRNNNTYKDKLKSKQSFIEYLNKLEEIIIRDIFNMFITMWAPPQLIILKTFPKEISYLVELITQQEHKCNSLSSQNKGESYKINPILIKEWVLPYLIDMRRHLRNLLVKQQKSSSEGTITWNYESRHISQDLDFFLLDSHDSIKIETMVSLVETVLFKVYVLYVPSMVGPFIRVENLCYEEVVINDLKEKKMYQELLDFYYHKEVHHDALEFLFDLNDKFKDNRIGPNMSIKDFIIKYLMLLPNENLDDLFFYLTKLLEQISDIHVRNNVLVSIFENCNIINLKRDSLKIYSYLKNIDKALSLEYLEFIIHTVYDINPKMHNYLVRRYISDLNDINNKKLQDFLKNNSQYNPSDIIVLLKNAISDETLTPEMKNFVLLMQVYPYYRLHKHEISIDILFNKLGDYKEAREYCNKVYLANRTVGSGILLYLLKAIIEKSNYRAGDHSSNELLVIFLKDYRDKLDIVQTLKTLPVGLPVKDIKDLLVFAIRHQKTKDEDFSLKKNIMQNELTNLNYSINHKSAKFIEVNSNNICYVCKKKFHSLTTDSVFWCYMPNGKEIIVHYNCGKSLEKRSVINKKNLLPTNKAEKMDLSALRRYVFENNK
ncbi:Vam6p PWA37_003205 [Arxiozyma heterogenica]|uniref:Vam6p n=1 Tax=Arxiozyma heterogenica TaxID=278026 RepID=UPI002EFDD834